MARNSKGPTDRMDKVLAAAVRQGFRVWQGDRGMWFFRKGSITITAAATPRTVNEWLQLLRSLEALGFEFPEKDRS